MSRIAFFIPDLRGGGAEKAVLKLVNGMSKRGIMVDLVMIKATGVYLQNIAENVSIIDLGKSRAFKAAFPLARYLKKQQPLVLISHLSHCNIVATISKKIARSTVKLILVEQLALVQTAATGITLKERLLRALMKRVYAHAKLIAAVSKDTAKNIEAGLGLKAGTIRPVYNPIVDVEILEKSQSPVTHPWLVQKKMPVFLAIGRLDPQKDFANLLNAFAMVRKQVQARLIILGEGGLRNSLEQQIAALGMVEDLSMPGFTGNPYHYMAHADVFVLSSLYEGLPTVLIEAMACGCTVVATDCPEGPSEILERGEYGTLVPVSNPAALADAMLKALKWQTDRKKLVARAACFSVEQSVTAYLHLINEITT